MSSLTDQDTELLKTKELSIQKGATGMIRRDNLPDDQVMRRSLQGFDQQDWELKLWEHGYVNELNADSMLYTCKDEFFTKCG